MSISVSINRFLRNLRVIRVSRVVRVSRVDPLVYNAGQHRNMSPHVRGRILDIVGNNLLQ